MKQITTSIIALAIGLVPANILAQTAYPEGFTEEVDGGGQVPLSSTFRI